MKRTFIVRLVAETRRESREMEEAMAGYIQDKGGKKCVTFDELRRPSHDSASAVGGWHFNVIGAVVESTVLRPELERRLLPWRNQADPRASRVHIVELPEMAAAPFWRHAQAKPREAVQTLLEHFPWNKGFLQ